MQLEAKCGSVSEGQQTMELHLENKIYQSRILYEGKITFKKETIKRKEIVIYTVT